MIQLFPQYAAIFPQMFEARNTMRHLCLLPACLLAVVLSLCGAVVHAAPNFVLILVDDLGRQDLGCEGSTFYETPNIDRIAANGTRFENAYSACQVCSPSRAAIQTGKSPIRVNITDYIAHGRQNQPENWKRNTALLPAAYDMQLPLEEVTIAEVLRDNGYKTFFAGKWHLGSDGFGPREQGYDINKGGHHAGSPPGGYFSPYRNPALANGPAGESLPLRLGRETAEFIESHKSQPFFAMLSFYSVHSPIQSTEELWSKYRNKAERTGLTETKQRFLIDRTKEVRQVQDHPVYAGMMEALDQAVGTVLAAIDRSGLADNTVVIFTSDNGGVSSGDGFATACLPFRGGKGRQWEGGIRQPLYIHWPGVTSGKTSDAFAIGMDLYPTILDIAGLPLMPQQHLDGVSLVPALQGKQMPPRSLYWHYPNYGNQGGEPSAIVRRGDWKLIRYFEDGRQELYNLANDVGEQHDRAKEQPALTAELAQDLDVWLKETGARFPTPNPNYNHAADVAAMEQLRKVGLPRREAEHAQFLQADFTPRGGWWQTRTVSAQSPAASSKADTKKDKWIPLFNGQNLEGWTPKIRGFPAGENFANTFRVEDGLLTVNYDGYDKFENRFGHLFYNKSFSRYRLRVEYRFVGDQISDGPGWATRNSGLMLHGETPQQMAVDQDFPASIEVQLLGGNGNDPRPTANLCTPYTHVVMDGGLLKRHCTQSKSQTYHGDQWVTVEVEVHGSKLMRHFVNGKPVLEYTQPQLDDTEAHTRELIKLNGGPILTGGTISLQSESHPVQFRKVELLPLDE